MVAADDEDELVMVSEVLAVKGVHVQESLEDG